MKTAYENSKELILATKPSMAYDGTDVEAWKSVARKKLSELIGLDKFTKVAPELEIEYEKDYEDKKEIRFTFESEAGYRVPCHLWLPLGVEKPPVIICLQGHSRGMHISLGNPKYPGDDVSISGGDRDFCVRAIKEGFAAIALEQRNFGESGGDPNGTPVCTDSSLVALLMGRTTVGERVWDVCRLIDVIEESFADLVDVDCISCMGNSGGGTTTVYTAALEDRIKLAMPSCSVSTFKHSIGTIRHCSCNYVPNIALYFDMGDLIAMASPKNYIQVSGQLDNIFPIEHAKEVFEHGKSAYAKMKAEDKCKLVVGSEGHRFYADDAWPIVHSLLGR